MHFSNCRKTEKHDLKKKEKNTVFLIHSANLATLDLKKLTDSSH